MNDTPRVNEAILKSNGQWSYALVHVARQLERELDDMTSFRDSETRWAAQYKQERDEAEQSAAKLSAELGRALSERDGLRYQLKRGEETAARMLEVTIQERDEAQECLREIVTGFAVCGCNANQIYSHNTITKQTLNRWRKSAGMEEEQ